MDARSSRSGGKPATEPAGAAIARRLDAVMAGFRDDPAGASDALVDPDPAVRASALGALDRLGALTPEQLAAGLRDPDPRVRRRAAELAGRHHGPDLLGLLADRDDAVVEMAAWSLGERGSGEAVERLARLADPAHGHRDPLVRESAVAALGAIGDPAGLPAVLAALSDKPAVRRRAATALAAFEGPEVTAALTRCLEDRDWQVRAIAEDLLQID